MVQVARCFKREFAIPTHFSAKIAENERNSGKTMRGRVNGVADILSGFLDSPWAGCTSFVERHPQSLLSSSKESKFILNPLKSDKSDLVWFHTPYVHLLTQVYRWDLSEAPHPTEMDFNIPEILNAYCKMYIEALIQKLQNFLYLPGEEICRGQGGVRRRHQEKS